MPAGRPFTIDRDELKKRAREYLDSECYKTIAHFCKTHRISRTWFFEVCAEDAELANLREQIKLEREVALEQGGLSGDMNASMAKFALAQIGWTEKQEIAQTNKNFNVTEDDSKVL